MALADFLRLTIVLNFSKIILDHGSRTTTNGQACQNTLVSIS